MKVKKMILAALLVSGLASCTSTATTKDISLNVLGVDLPPSIRPAQELTVSVRYRWGCVDSEQQLNLVSRTASTLTLTASSVTKVGDYACSGVYIEKTLTYTDPGTSARTNPFEVIVNGKSWGKVAVKNVETVATPFHEVLFPHGITPSAPLSITGRYVNNCVATAANWRVVSRTPHQLKLESTQEVNNDPNIACLPVYSLDHVVYVDKSAIDRLDPFEIVVNGQSWGQVAVSAVVPADPTESVADLQNSYLPLMATATESLHLNLGSAQQPTPCTKYRFDVNRSESRLDLKVIQRQTETCAAPDSIGTVYYLDPPTPTRTTPFTVIKNGQPWGTIEIK